MPDDVDVAQYYNLPTAYPEEWPAQLDDGDAPETVPDDAAARKKQLKQQRKSARYSALGLATSRNLASAPFRAGAGDHASGKDEPDPLGSSDSVLHMLRQRGLPVDEDPQLRGRYMLSSTNFSPALFLSHAHSSASTQSLMEGLEFLSRSIDQKSASLKVLVESNFERFVRAKATIDSVYTEMRNQQTDKRFSHTRRISGHYRFSLQGAPPPPPPPVPSRKTALTKETEYGVQGIREPLVEASLKAEELWGPALSGREREQGLYAVLAAIEKNRAVYEIGGNLARAIKQRDYDSIFEAYRQARTLANEAKNITDRAVTEQRQLTDDESHTILVTGRMWIDVQQQVEAFKRELWRRLNNVHTSSQQHVTAASPVEEHMELICALLELGVEDNPVWIWLLSRYDLIKTRIKSFCERARAEIEILRRRLDAGDKPSPQVTTSFLRLSPRDATEPRDPMDTDAVLELWECIHTFLTKLLSTQNGLLGEVVDFWENAQSFIDGNKQKLLPAGFEGESRRHHRLSSDGVRQLRDGVVDLIELIRSAVLSLFADPPPEDVSALAAPPPANPATPMGHLTPTESRFKLDPKNVPPPTAGRGDPWEGFAFWPPYSNSLSGVHYLSKFLIIIGTAASEMSALSPVASSGGMHDQLKNLVSIARERSVRIACSAWNKDAENCKLLEDWTRDPERRELTKMPGFFVAFESAVLADMQKILYISEAMSKPGSKEVVTPPPAKLLQMVRSQFVTSVYKALSGLVENAERPLKTDEDDEWSTVGPRPTVPMRSVDAAMTIVTRDNIDAKNRNIRMLLTLSNLKALQADFVPRLVSNFETAFSVKLTEEAKTIRDVVDQIDARLFQSYTKPTVAALDANIRKGITAPDWVPATSPPEHVRPYVYNTMLTLVLVHNEITSTIPLPPGNPPTPTAHPLLTSVLTHLVTQISISLLNAFMERSRYTLPALMQATLDTEFIAQTMSQYVNEEASQIQSHIYLELDQRTSNEARAKLQAELGDMRGILKRLRERTKGQFACFRKPRVPISERR